jgi:predicted nucleic acid-binding protein
MRTTFADTYFYLALVSEDDAGHIAASEFAATWTGRTITTAWVITEVADALADPSQRPVFARLLLGLKNDPQLVVVPPTQELFERGIDLFNRRPDKEWSLTDCISFVVMHKEDLTDALTADHHFEQAGFNVLLK